MSTLQTPKQASNSASTYRNLVFGGSVPFCIRVAPEDLTPNSDRAIDCFYIQASRNTYLPLLLPEIRQHLLELVLDEQSLATLKEDTIWFEHAGIPLKWHWPIGLLYDYASAHSIKAKHDPLEVILHLKTPPSDKLLLGPSVDACRTNFMNLVKEADFVRWGSTRRVTQLRKVDQDALWEGVVQNDYDRFWSTASKLVPLPSSSRTPSPASDIAAPSTLADGRLPDASAMRSVPLRIYLPDNAPIIQDIVPPLLPNGRAATLYHTLSTILPLIFPSRTTDLSASFVSSKPLGQVIAHGIKLPHDAEVGFLASTMASVDGWLHLVISLA